jgi:hypothetical protein
MRRQTPKPIRNKLDPTDRVQMRLVRKRLGLSNAELTAIVGRIGNSISAISKEATQQRANALPKTADVPAVAVIAAAGGSDPASIEISAGAPTS